MAKGKLTPEGAASTVKFHFIKSPTFQIDHVDGAFGGITPRGTINIMFYSERNPLPKTVEHEVQNGVVGRELKEKRESKDGIIRDVSRGVVMDIAVAVSLRDWLSQKIDEHKRIYSELPTDNDSK